MAAQPDPPAGLQDYKARRLPNGALLEFEFALAGSVAPSGGVRKRDYRAYWLTPAGAEKRERMVSVTTLLDAIIPKGGLPFWAEARGIEGAVQAMRLGELDGDTTPLRAVEIVRGLKLGADRARDRAAERGVNVHALLETYMRTGDPPALADHPAEHHGYLRGLCSWLLKRNPEPRAVEELVCEPSARYAGRMDLIANVGDTRIGWDAKTQVRCGIYAGAHVQLRLYERAQVACGGEPCDELRIVVFAADGEWREMVCEASETTAGAALAFAGLVRPIDGLCEAQNRVERKARQ